MFKYLIILLLCTAGFQASEKNIPKVHIVEIKGMKFIPQVLVISKGDQVIWINRDLMTHNVTNENGAWASPALSEKKTWKKTITMNTKYYCSFHPVMKGSIIVK